MSDWRVLTHAATGNIVLARTKLCASFWCHFKGLMLRGALPEDEGLLFITDREGVVHTTIHMFFMRFSIGVVWLNAQRQVVDKQLAKPWRPAYAPCGPARYYLEANVSILDRVQVGDVLNFDQHTD
jgi:uncharacterized membrane protein (UPF0127 family)